MNNINIKASILTSSFEKIVGVVSKTTPSMPLLGHILLRCSKGTLIMTATDLEV
ncbi:uncharacterized protein METZ01_LOCUS325984, partial [marine metagenome]